MRQLRLSPASTTLVLLVVAALAGQSTRALSAGGPDNAIGQLDPLGIRLACGTAVAPQTRACLFTFVAPPGDRFPADASAEAVVLDGDGNTATIACEIRGPTGASFFACLIPLPPGLAASALGLPLTYSLLLQGGSKAQSVCGWLETGYPPGPCGP